VNTISAGDHLYLHPSYVNQPEGIIFEAFNLADIFYPGETRFRTEAGAATQIKAGDRVSLYRSKDTAVDSINQAVSEIAIVNRVNGEWIELQWPTCKEYGRWRMDGGDPGTAIGGIAVWPEKVLVENCHIRNFVADGAEFEARTNASWRLWSVREQINCSISHIRGHCLSWYWAIWPKGVLARIHDITLTGAGTFGANDQGNSLNVWERVKLNILQWSAVNPAASTTYHVHLAEAGQWAFIDCEFTAPPHDVNTPSSVGGAMAGNGSSGNRLIRNRFVNPIDSWIFSIHSGASGSLYAEGNSYRGDMQGHVLWAGKRNVEAREPALVAINNSIIVNEPDPAASGGSPTRLEPGPIQGFAEPNIIKDNVLELYKNDGTEVLLPVSINFQISPAPDFYFKAVVDNSKQLFMKRYEWPAAALGCETLVENSAYFDLPIINDLPANVPFTAIVYLRCHKTTSADGGIIIRVRYSCMCGDGTVLVNNQYMKNTSVDIPNGQTPVKEYVGFDGSIIRQTARGGILSPIKIQFHREGADTYPDDLAVTSVGLLVLSGY
jgi:hypothetical protein